MNEYSMTNVKVLHTDRTVFNGHKDVEIYKVVADTERFGESEIMCEGSFKDCLAYLKRNGIDYTKMVVDTIHRSDIQVSNRMCHIDSIEDGVISFTTRDHYEYKIHTSLLVPIGYKTFALVKEMKRNAFKRFDKPTSCKYTVKMDDAMTW